MIGISMYQVQTLHSCKIPVEMRSIKKAKHDSEEVSRGESFPDNISNFRT